MAPNFKAFFLHVFLLQMIPKSHKCGRVDHKKYSAQVEADLERVEYYKTKLGELMMIPNSISVRDQTHCEKLNRKPKRYLYTLQGGVR